MKLDKRHMSGSLAVLASSIVYNVWVFTRPAPRPAGSGAPAEIMGESSPGVIADEGRPAAIDPTQVPELPNVAVDRLPEWPRDPFQNLRERPQVAVDATESAPAPPPAVEADPVVASILYSTARRLAVIDGRIVRPGDRVGGSMVIDILPKAVILESADGERRTLELKPPSTGVRRQ